MTRPPLPAAATFQGASGNTLIGDVYGEQGAPVLLLHGGGQTRHAWKKTGELIAQTGRTAYAVDQRGHGDSQWVQDGAYQYEDFAADARTLADTLAERSGIGERSDAVLRTATGERSDAVLRTATGERSDAVLRTAMLRA
jgi:pimeloyl-ACP methyl ester carboxylesterase